MRALSVIVLLGVVAGALAQGAAKNCTAYCSAYATAGCVAGRGGAINYSTTDACLTECSFFPDVAGCDIATGVNCSADSQQCRWYHATVAATSVANGDVHCQHTAPFSAGNASLLADGPCKTVGTICENFCDNWAVTCAGFHYADKSWCMAACARHDKTGAFEAQLVYPLAAPASADDFKCRRYHIQAARGGTTNADIHCPHATIGAGGCGSSCSAYCTQVQGACTGANQLFADVATCLSTCNNYTVTGAKQATSGNSYECRFYHSVAANFDPVTHCPHASPSGGGICVAPSPTPAPTSGAAGVSPASVTVALVLAASALRTLF